MIYYAIDEILEAMERISELETLNLQELCDECDIKYSITLKDKKTAIICDLIIKEYGHDMLIHWIDFSESQKMPEVKQYNVQLNC